MTRSQIQAQGLSRRQAIVLRKRCGEVTPVDVAREIERHGKWARKSLPPTKPLAPRFH